MLVQSKLAPPTVTTAPRNENSSGAGDGYDTDANAVTLSKSAKSSDNVASNSPSTVLASFHLATLPPKNVNGWFVSAGWKGRLSWYVRLLPSRSPSVPVWVNLPSAFGPVVATEPTMCSSQKPK